MYGAFFGRTGEPEYEDYLEAVEQDGMALEIVPDEMPIEKSDGSLFWIRRPVDEDEWCETLEQVLRRTPTPQWADA